MRVNSQLNKPLRFRRARGFFLLGKRGFMSEKVCEVRLENGTVIRHRVAGYEGIVDGTTEIRDCFTAGGEPLSKLSSKHTFQYRIAISGESLCRIAPAEDLEVLEGSALVLCSNCRRSFQSKPGSAGKLRGRCQCGGWICPSCLYCQGAVSDSATAEPSVCLYQRKRLVRQHATEKRPKSRKNNLA